MQHISVKVNATGGVAFNLEINKKLTKLTNKNLVLDSVALSEIIIAIVNIQIQGECKIMKLKLIYGIQGLKDDVRKLIEDAMVSLGGEIQSSIARGNKAAVLHSVDNARNEKDGTIVLIISHKLDRDDPFNISDLISCQEAIPSINVILVVDREERGSNLLKEMCANGFYHAVFDKDSDEDMIARLAVRGRNVTEARQYYGLNNDTASRGRMSIEKALEYVLGAKDEGETYAERLAWIKEKVNNEIAFREIINRLPDDAKESLSKDARFETYIADYLKAKADEAAERERQDSKEKELLKREQELERQEELARIGKTDAKIAITRALRRMVIGVSGTEHRVGCTHHAIHLAHYLCNQGYRVAVAEYEGMDKKVLDEILQCVCGGETTYRGVDYYPDFSLSNLPSLNTKNYHFVIIDFGVYKKEIREEFGRCVQQILVCGSKPWELRRIKNVFSILGLKDEPLNDDGSELEEQIEFDKLDDQLSYYDYLLPPVEKKDEEVVRKAIGPFDNVHFADYVTNPFLGEKSAALSAIMKDYMVDSIKSPTPTSKSSSLKERIGRFFS